MIISHKYKFIFIKTYKTAGSSIEAYLSDYCADNDILTPVWPPAGNHRARNYRGFMTPVSDIFQDNGQKLKTKIIKNLQFKKFYNHIPAITIKNRVSRKIWNSYFKFCVERNPWDKTISHYSMLNSKSDGKISIEKYFSYGNFPLNYPFYCSHEGKIIVDRIIHYENLHEDLGSIFNMLSIPYGGKLRMQAKSNYRNSKQPYQDMYTDANRIIVEEYFSKEIQMHGYTF